MHKVMQVFVEETHRMHLVKLDSAEPRKAWEMMEPCVAHMVTLASAVGQCRMHPEWPGFALRQKVKETREHKVLCIR